MLEVQRSGKGIFSYEMVGPKSNHTPAKFVVTLHYAFQEGATLYSVLVRLSDMVSVRAGEECKGRGNNGENGKTGNNEVASSPAIAVSVYFNGGIGRAVFMQELHAGNPLR